MRKLRIIFNFLKNILKKIKLGNKGNSPKPDKKMDSDRSNKNQVAKSNRKKRIRKWLLFIVLIIIIIDIVLIFLVGFHKKTLVLWILVFGSELSALVILIIFNIIKKRNRRNKKNNVARKILIKLRKWCKYNKVKFRKVPFILMIGREDSDKTSLLLNCWYNKMQDSVLGDCNTKIWTSRSSFVISTAGSNNGATFDESVNSNLAIFLKELKRNNENPINSIIIPISVELILEHNEQWLSEHGKNIAAYLYGIQNILERKMPVYFLLTKCDKILGLNSFFSILAKGSTQNVFGYTAPLKNDESINMETVKKGLDEIVTNMEDIREKLLTKIKIPDLFEKKLNYTDTFYSSTYYVKNIFQKMKVLLAEAFGEYYHNNMVLPFRGIYFVSSGESCNPSNEHDKFNVEENDGNTVKPVTKNHVAARSPGMNSLFARDVFERVIYKEVNTVVPLTKDYYRKRTLNRIILFLYVTVFVILLYLHYDAYKKFKSGVNVLYREWVVTENRSNWKYNRFLPVVEFRSDKNVDEDSSGSDKSKIQYGNLSFDPMVKLSNGKSVYEFLSKISKEGNSLNYPLLLSPYKYIPYTNIYNNEEKALGVLYITSFVYPIFNGALQTMLYNNNVQWNKTTYGTMFMFKELLTYMANQNNRKNLFTKNGTGNLNFEYMSSLVRFLYKNNSSVNNNKYDQNKVYSCCKTICNNMFRVTSYLDNNGRWPDSLRLEERLKTKDGIDSIYDLELLLIKRFQTIIDFPLVHENIFDTCMSYNNFIRAKYFLDLINPEIKIEGNEEIFELSEWIRAAKILSDVIIQHDFADSTNSLVLKRYTDEVESEGNKSKKIKNAAEIFVALNLVTGQDKEYKPILTRIPHDQLIETITNDRSYSKAIYFYTTYKDAKAKKPACILNLPEYWTVFYLLLDGPKDRPINYKYPYWATWDSAVNIGKDQWESRIRITSGEKGYFAYIKFTLNDQIAEYVKKLSSLSDDFSFQKDPVNKSLSGNEQEGLEQNLDSEKSSKSELNKPKKTKPGKKNESNKNNKEEKSIKK